MLLQKLIFKFKYPLLRFLSLQKLGGLYSRSGEDTLLLSVVFTSLNSNSSNSIIEIDRPAENPYSVTNTFVRDFSCDAFVINTNKNLVFTCANNDQIDLELPSITEMPDDVSHGMISSLKKTVLQFNYLSEQDLLNALINKTSTYKFISIIYNTNSLNILKGLLKNTSIYYILIQNNNSGNLCLGNDNIRKYLAQFGYIYHSRLNNKDDLFVLSEFINGFPSKSFEILNTVSLQKWLSEPPNSDYTTAR